MHEGCLQYESIFARTQFYMGCGAVVKYLTNAPSEKLYDLSKKFTTLTSMLCVQRPKEILGFIDIRNLSFEDNFLVIRIGDINENIK